MVTTWAVVPTKNRPQLVRNLLKSLVGQVDGAIVVDNNDVPDVYDDIHPTWVTCVHRPGYPPNISELLNVGMDVASEHARLTNFDIVLLNDDVVCPPGWVQSLSTAMRATTAVMAYTDRLNRPDPILWTTPPRSPFDAATVCACIVRGEANMRFDESMRWWWSDTDMDFRCRQQGGVLAVPGQIPEHLHPSAQTFADAELSAQTHRDRETFDRKWSGVPW
jgi:hypothetical protein